MPPDYWRMALARSAIRGLGRTGTSLTVLTSLTLTVNQVNKVNTVGVALQAPAIYAKLLQAA